MSRLPVAVIGAGHLGRVHARLLKSNAAVELVGVVDPLAAARQKAADELGVAAYAHLYEVLDKIDAAIVATSTSSHHDVALELLRSGVHCFVEKPLCSTLAQADELVAAAREQRLVLQAGHVERFNPALAALDALPEGICYLEATRTSGYTFRSTDIGVVLDLMIHDIDLALCLAGGRVTDVQALGMTVVGPHEDLAQARLTFDNGSVANLWASRVCPTSQRTLSVYTEGLHAALDLSARTVRLLRPRHDVLSGQLAPQALSTSQQQQLQRNVFVDLLPVETVEAPACNAIVEEHRDFLAGILEGRPVRVPGEAGCEALAVAETILATIAETSQLVASPSTIPTPHFLRLAQPQLRRAG